MKTIHIIGSNEQRVYHDNFKPYQCKTSEVLPKMYNGGFNDYHFCDTVNFTFANMPLIPKYYANSTIEQETDNYKWYSCTIQLTDITGHTISGCYYITFDKKANKFISENVDFS